MKSSLPNYRQSPRKVRLVANLVRGMKVSRALVELNLLPKRASDPIKKLILSAVANAKENHKVDSGELFVKDLRVDKGIVLKRSMPRAHGRAFGINKRTSHIHVVLEEAKKETINNKQITINKKSKGKIVKKPVAPTKKLKAKI